MWGNTPYRFYKQYGHEGGPRTHFIATWPGKVNPGFCHASSHIVDIYPTLLELAGAEYPATLPDGSTPTLDGSSLLPLLKGDDRDKPDILISGFTDRFRMVRIGDWKIVRVNEGPWELYNIKEDPTELNNLAHTKTDKLSELVARYKNLAKRI